MDFFFGYIISGWCCIFGLAADCPIDLCQHLVPYLGIWRVCARAELAHAFGNPSSAWCGCICESMHQTAGITCHLVSPRELLQVAGLQSSQCELAGPGKLDVPPPWPRCWSHLSLAAFQAVSLCSVSVCSKALRSFQKYTTSTMSAFRALFF